MLGCPDKGADGVWDAGQGQGQGGMIDWERVTSLRDEVGEDEFRPLVEMFLDEIEAGLMALGSANPVVTWDSLNLLKGCSLNLGLTAFFRICDTWEKLMASGNADQLEIDLLLASYATSKQLLLRDLDWMTGGQGATGVA